MKKLLALPFLPAEDIEQVFNELRDGLSPYVRQRMNSYNTYYSRYWINIIKPEGFSVFGLTARTNNVIESFHATLLRKLSVHPVAWDFFCKYKIFSTKISETMTKCLIFFAAKLQKVNDRARKDYVALQHGRQVRSAPRYQTIYKQNVLFKGESLAHVFSQKR